ncbi:MAG: MEDS domain-containing protein [Proteobacteria bacterium]|nr:MEDS domain-containing protein [Pseudomonadota bacterium]
MILNTDISITVPMARCSIENPDGRHFCQLHHEAESLVDAIYRFANTGLREGERVMLVAPDERNRNVLERLRVDGVDTAALVRTGRLSVQTPGEIRDACLRGGVFDTQRFRNLFATLFRQYDAGVRMRLYGELSNSFWHEGDVETAALLEEICHEVRGERRIAVFCGYLFDGLDQDSYRTGIERICRVHSCFPETPEDDRLREAVDAASREVIGIPLSVALNRTHSDGGNWWDRLPLARRTILWLQAHMPGAMIRVLDLARSNYRAGQDRSA